MGVLARGECCAVYSASNLSNPFLSKKKDLGLQCRDVGWLECVKSTARIVQKAGRLKTSEEILISNTHSTISILEAGILQHLE